MLRRQRDLNSHPWNDIAYTMEDRINKNNESSSGLVRDVSSASGCPRPEAVEMINLQLDAKQNLLMTPLNTG